MLRRFVIALSVVAMLGALTATQAGAKPSPVRSKAVCGVSQFGHVRAMFRAGA